jgi:hypothetical protein
LHYNKQIFDSDDKAEKAWKFVQTETGEQSTLNHAHQQQSKAETYSNTLHVFCPQIIHDQ